MVLKLAFHENSIDQRTIDEVRSVLSVSMDDFHFNEHGEWTHRESSFTTVTGDQISQLTQKFGLQVTINSEFIVIR